MCFRTRCRAIRRWADTNWRSEWIFSEGAIARAFLAQYCLRGPKGLREGDKTRVPREGTGKLSRSANRSRAARPYGLAGEPAGLSCESEGVKPGVMGGGFSGQNKDC